MIEIRPISDLRNKFSEIEKIVQHGEPIYLTKNGYGSMVVMSLEHYSMLTDTVEYKLNEADEEAKNAKRLTHENVFNKARKAIRAVNEEV